MILAIPIEDKSDNSKIAIRFARAKYYAILDKHHQSLEILPNPCLGISVQTGKCTILYLTTRKKVDTLVAYEFGLNVQQYAQKNNMQMILIDKKNSSLDQLLKLIKFNIPN